MKVAIVGTGYVGLPTGVGFAELGHDVFCIDQIEQKINDLNNGKITLYEVGLEELLLKNLSSGRLKFTTKMEEGVKNADMVIIAVGTPTHPITKESDMKYVYAAAAELAQHLGGYTVVAVKSTVPVGTGGEVAEIIANGNPRADFDVVSLPEFLREGFAVEDFFNPDRIVIGTDSDRARAVISKLYSSFEGKTAFLYVSRKSSEAIKYAANSFLAVKVHYINEMANFCEKSGADINEVAKGMGLDTRIGAKFLQPGPGYGGSCFPKDTTAMASMARNYGVKLTLIETTIEQNEARKKEMARRIMQAAGEAESPVVAALGVTFKSGTDDVRESPAMDIITELVKSGAAVKVYDPKGMDNARALLKDDVYYASGIADACAGADICAILTEWRDFKDFDYAAVRGTIRSPVIVDLRNLLDKKAIPEEGFTYYSLG